MKKWKAFDATPLNHYYWLKRKSLLKRGLKYPIREAFKKFGFYFALSFRIQFRYKTKGLAGKTFIEIILDQNNIQPI